jgi:hypothetical protein
MALAAGSITSVEPAPPSTPPEIACKLHHPVSEVGSLAAMPPPIVAFVRERMGADAFPNISVMAERGAFFNITDVIMKPAPGRRFMRAGHSGGFWFLWYEHGGIAYIKNIAVFAQDGMQGRPRLVAHIGYFREDPCALTDAVLNGQTPPQTPQSAWW